MRTLLLIGIFLTFGILNAQTDFKPGYIIKNSGDTIYGQIDDRKAKSMSQLCRFKNSENSIREYLPKDIKAYRFINDKYYVSKEIESQSYFWEYLINGKLNVYYSKHDNFGHYYVDDENNPLVELPYEESTQYIDGKRIAFKSNKHIGILNYYTQDAPQLKSKILAIKKPNHNELINLAEEYHNALSDEFDSLIYKKNKLKVRLSPELVVGVLNGVDSDFNTAILQFGLIGHLNLLGSKATYLRTGINYSRFDIEPNSILFNIPFQLEYIYPKGLFRPRIAYGLNLYIPTGLTIVATNFGGNLRISENIFITINSEIQFGTRTLFLPTGVFSYSLQLGLYKSLN